MSLPEPLPTCWTWTGPALLLPDIAFPRPVLVVVVDTEEQFDWSGPFDRGATGVSQWTPLARMYTAQRTLRLADGPDEVHWHVVGRAELASWEPQAADYDPKVAYYAGLDAKSGDAIFSGP